VRAFELLGVFAKGAKVHGGSVKLPLFFKYLNPLNKKGLQKQRRFYNNLFNNKFKTKQKIALKMKMEKPINNEEMGVPITPKSQKMSRSSIP
jgi:hypothetical protein